MLVSAHTGFVTLNKARKHSLTEPPHGVTVKIKGDIFVIHLTPCLTQSKDSINVSFYSS